MYVRYNDVVYITADDLKLPKRRSTNGLALITFRLK